MSKSRKPSPTEAFSSQGRNGMDAFSVYKFRKFYKDRAYPDSSPDYGVHGEGFDANTQPQPIDLWHEAPYFGRYKLNANSIYILEKNLKQIPTKNNEKTFLVTNFVADAFRDLQKHFSSALISKNLNPDFKLSSLPITKAYENPDTLHQLYINKIFEVFVLSYVESQGLHKKIVNFSDFVGHLSDFIRDSQQSIPFTFSGFLGSKRCPSSVSGLIIDMKADGFSDDKNKMNKFLSKEDFSFYLYSARNHGFMVDKNVPWRLVADISSPKMKEYMVKYDPTLNESNLFKKYYADAYIADLEIMLKNIVSYYNNYIESRPFTSKTYHAYSSGEVGTTKQKMKTITRNKRKRKASLKRIFQTYGIDNIMSFYFTIRCYESGAASALRDRENIVLEAVNRKNTLGLSYALSYLNSKILDQIKIDLTIGTEYVKGNNEKARSLLNARQPQDKEPNIKDVISGDYSRK